MSRLALILALLLAPAAWAQSPSQVFEETWRLVETHFVHPSMLVGVVETAHRDAKLAVANSESPEETVRIVNAVLAQLKTSHTRLYCSQEPEYFELLDIFAYGSQGPSIMALFDGALPHYTGILATMDGETVVDVVPGGPADQAGLRSGDRISGISEHPDGPFLPYHPIRSLLGQEGRELYLQVASGLVIGPRKVVPIDVQPRSAFLRSISESVDLVEREGYQLGYLRAYSYAGEPFQERVIEQLQGPLAEADGLVLDLRGGWGGAQPSYLEIFQPLPRLSLASRDGNFATVPSEHWNRPVVMVVDGRTKSGKEILAHGFKSQGLGPVVGTRTAGAVSAGRLFLLPGGYALYLAVMDVEVDGQRLEGLGVEPDQIMTEPNLPSADPDVKEQALTRLLQDLRERDATLFPKTQ